jgi:cytochrome c peroxidase
LTATFHRILAAASLVVVGCSEADKASPTAAPPAAASSEGNATGDDISPRLLRRFQALKPVEADKDPAMVARVELGRRLFYDARLSKGNQLSCNGCHALDRYGVDGKTTSIGFDGRHGTRNAPTVFNAAGSFSQFWDGRAADVEEQAKGPLLGAVEMAMESPAAVEERLRAIPSYGAAFSAAFPGEGRPLSFDNVVRAIGAFERRLVTPGRWDRFLAGDRNALTHEEKQGLKTFLNVGCMVCHTGPLVGGSMFERVGAVEPWPNQNDPGRMAVTHAEADRMMFKVPTLRNVEKTAPYFHDGSAATLSEAVQRMGKHQLGLELSSTETESIVAWLRSLTGDLPTALIAEPREP